MAKALLRSEMEPSADASDSIASLYDRLVVDRHPYEDRARENAELTIPALMPPEGMSPGDELTKPYQSIGAHGLNTLTAKIVSTLLPTEGSMFRFSVNDEVVEKLTEDKTQRSSVEKKLNEVERSIQEEIEFIGTRAILTEGVKHLLNSGNVLLVLPKNGPLKAFRLDRYVVQRDSEGTLLRVIIKETVALLALPPYVQELLRKETPDATDQKQKLEKEFDLYTVYERREDGRIHTHQSIKGIILERTKGSWPADKAPVMPLRWNYMYGEDYGRAYVSEYYGDLSAAENLSRSLREAAAASARFNPMVNPAGITRYEDVVNARNLDVIAGRKEDVTMLQFEKQADMQVVQVVLQDIMARLQHAFMMNKSVQRNADRVTAEEIRAMVGDLEAVLGGAYSLLAREFQHPFVVRMIDRMERLKLIPQITHLKGPQGQIVKPKIITGVDALGRGQEYGKYQTFIKDVLLPFKEVAMQEVNMSDLFKRAAVSLSIDDDGLLKSDESKEQDKAKQQAQMQQMQGAQMTQDVIKGAVPPMAKAAAENFDPAAIQEMMGQAAQ